MHDMAQKPWEISALVEGSWRTGQDNLEPLKVRDDPYVEATNPHV